MPFGMTRWNLLQLAVLAALLASILAVPAVREAAFGFVDGAFGGRNNFNLWSTLGRASILVGMAMAVTVSFRAGLINLGGEGQLVLGGLAAALVGIHAPGPPLIVGTLALLAAMAAGCLWSVVAGALTRGTGMPLLVASLLLNYPANFFASWLASHPLRDVVSGIAQTHRINSAARLPRFDGTILDYGIFLVAAVAVLVVVLDHRSVIGYRLRMHGISAEFARASGFPVGRLYYQALATSGAIAGMVGFVVVFGSSQRYIDGMLTVPLYAWTAIVAVLLARTIPWVVPFSAALFAVLVTGASGMERVAGVPSEVAQVVQGVLILLLAGAGLSLTGRTK